MKRSAEQPWFEVRTGAMAFSLFSHKGGKGWGEVADYVQINIPSPRPTHRLGGEREWTPRWPDFSGRLKLVWVATIRIGAIS